MASISWSWRLSLSQRSRDPLVGRLLGSGQLLTSAPGQPDDLENAANFPSLPVCIKGCFTTGQGKKIKEKILRKDLVSCLAQSKSFGFNSFPLPWETFVSGSLPLLGLRHLGCTTGWLE